MKNWVKYFLYSVLAWFIVDFTTTNAIANASEYYSAYMPTLLIFYMGLPLIFSLLIYKFNFKSKGIFIATIISIILVEIIFTGNQILLAFQIMFLTIPLALAYYSMLTFVPWWIVEGKIKENKKWFLITLSIYIFGTLLNILIHLSGNAQPIT